MARIRRRTDAGPPITLIIGKPPQKPKPRRQHPPPPLWPTVLLGSLLILAVFASTLNSRPQPTPPVPAMHTATR